MSLIKLLVLFTFSVTFSLSASSNNAKNEEKLVLSSCKSLNNESATISAMPCTYYIQGFLAGALNTSQQYELRNNTEGFADRAYRTRVGTQTSKKLPTIVCIPSDITREQLVQQIVDRTINQLSPSTDSFNDLHRQVYQALADESSCEQND
ncbi:MULTISPECIES: hypothetical protein [unclassified Shewanella]|uniref:hypothetical protein n=1 Tax=unclassified Shewanella TaxID=196818 RepID=UPI000C867E87|nr:MULTISPECIES: hypothetical protein [unclassified Shewanella]MDO6774938.1 hypothetical protein [Shewanella sp. 3_MG-2023]PMG41260.1 hypothetical protein BCU91_10645 [Shewanella sp. 10N.286.52.B9]